MFAALGGVPALPGRSRRASAPAVACGRADNAAAAGPSIAPMSTSPARRRRPYPNSRLSPDQHHQRQFPSDKVHRRDDRRSSGSSPSARRAWRSSSSTPRWTRGPVVRFPASRYCQRLVSDPPADRSHFGAGCSEERLSRFTSPSIWPTPRIRRPCPVCLSRITARQCG